MNKEAVLHCNTEEYVYPISRNRLIFRIRTASRDIQSCFLIYFDRTKPENKKKIQLKCTYRDGLYDYFQEEVFFCQVARYQKYYFLLTDYEGKEWYLSANSLSESVPEDGYFEYLYANETDVIKTPEWAKGIIYYQIFPERFCDGNPRNNPAGCMEWGSKPDRENYMGGDLEGIFSKIPYLKELGVECLYLNPIFQGDFNHKYATTDYYTVDASFGGNEALKKLICTCHEAGIRVMLDGVFNHTGIHFKPFEDVLSRQEASPYTDWFHITKLPVTITHHDYECVGAYKWMPKLKTGNPDVRDFIIKVMLYWIEQYGIDGWRLDVADEVDASVWEEARLQIKEKHPDVLLLGETWGYAGKLLRGNQMDCVMNYVFRDALRDYFALDKISAVEFDHRLNHMLAYYKEETNQVQYNLLDSHDTERFLFLCKERKELLKLAAAFQLMFIGSPAIYYGDEAGMTGDNDPDCRRCMVFDELADGDIFRWYQKLIALRKENNCIRKGKFKSLLAENETDTYGFIRYLEGESLSIIIHKGASCCTVTCPVPDGGSYLDELTGEEFTSTALKDRKYYNADIAEYREALTISMQPYSVRVINKKNRRM